MWAVGKPGERPRIWWGEPVDGSEPWFEDGDVIVEAEAIDSRLAISADGSALELCLDAVRQERLDLAAAERERRVSEVWSAPVAADAQADPASVGQAILERLGACHIAAATVNEALQSAATLDEIDAVDIEAAYNAPSS